jgi:hypothetical protein
MPEVNEVRNVVSNCRIRLSLAVEDLGFSYELRACHCCETQREQIHKKHFHFQQHGEEKMTMRLGLEMPSDLCVIVSAAMGR